MHTTLSSIEPTSVHNIPPPYIAARAIEIHGSTISIRIPMQTLHKGSQKLIMLPKSENTHAPKYAPDNTMVKALARGWHWKKLLDTGKFSSAEAIAKKYNLRLQSVCLMLRLNLLSPQIKQAILDGRHPRTMTMETLKEPFPDEWQAQLRHFGFER